jgi:hypothetical protein
MAGKADIEAGKAYVSLYVKNSALVKGLQSASKQLQSWGANIAKIGGSMMAAGGAVMAPMAAMVKGFSDAGSQLADMSARTGASAETLSALGYAAGMTGSSMEDVEKALRKMQQNGMGIDQLDAVANRMAAITDPAERTRFAIETFGKAGAAMIPMLSGGAAGLAEFHAEAERLGLVMSTEDANAADALGDAMDKVTGSLKGAAMQIGAALAPMVTKLADIITNVVASAVAWLKNNRQLVVTIAAVAAGVVTAGAVIVGTGAAVSALGFALSGVATALTAVGSVVGFLISPLGLVIAGVVAGAAAFLKFTEAGQKTVAWFSGVFSQMLATAKSTMSGISDAISGGDLALAGQIAFAGLKLAAAEGIVSLSNLVGGLWGDTIASIGSSLLSGDFAGAWDTAVMGMGAMWESFNKGVLEMWIGTAAIITETWSKTVQGITDWMLKTASQEGAIGKAMSTILGVDMQSENARRDKLNAQAKSMGLATSESGLGEAQRVAREQIKQMEGAIKNELQAAQERGMGALGSSKEDALRNRVGGSGSAMSGVVGQLEAELAALKQKAAEAAAKAANEKGMGLEGPGGMAGGKGSVAASFSAAALSALGAGGGVMDRLLKTNEAQKALQQKQLETAQQTTTAVIALNTMLALTP